MNEATFEKLEAAVEKHFGENVNFIAAELQPHSRTHFVVTFEGVAGPGKAVFKQHFTGFDFVNTL